ncbi:MAG: hypothetical protein L0Y68_07860 [Candidatus Dadabacteria bacterium]|nr:hypothetical protein [Candidatus Dadabacteria bacterium]
MRMLLISILIITILTAIGISSFAETEQQIKRIVNEGEIADSGNFLTIKDEKGEAHLIKTIGVLRFGGGSLKLETWEASFPVEKKDTITIENQTPSE